MKKAALIFAGIAICLAAGNSIAGETSPPKEVAGVTGGAVVGALAGGPVGFILGAALGGFVGDRWHQDVAAKQDLSMRLDESVAKNRELGNRNTRLGRELRLAREEGDPAKVLARVIGDGLDLRILFRTEDATLDPADSGRLDIIAKLLGAAPSLTVSVEGHTDLRGADAFNQTLSAQRARTVRDRLVELGIGAERITLLAAGEAEANGTADDPDGMALDRRAEVRVRPAPARVASD